jgi:hypothetical protein
MTGTDLCVNKSQFVPVIFEPPCNTMICAFVHGVIVYKYILHNPNIVRYVDN